MPRLMRVSWRMSRRMLRLPRSERRRVAHLVAQVCGALVSARPVTVRTRRAQLLQIFVHRHVIQTLD